MPAGQTAPPDTIGKRLHALATGRPAGPALGAPGRADLTFGDLWAAVDATRGAFRARGVGPDDVVASVLPDGRGAAVAFLAVSSAAVAAPLSPAMPPMELERALRRLGARAVLTSPDGTGAVTAAATRAGAGVLTVDGDAGSWEIEGPDLAAPVVAADPCAGDVALLLATSGTTGEPKVVPLTHANLLASADRWVGTLALGPGDRGLGVMPLFHVHGLVVGVLAALAAGGSVSYRHGFDAAEVLHAMGDEPITWITAVPSMWAALADRARSRPAAVPAHTLRFLRSASAPLPPRVLAEVEASLGVPLLEGYAMTETASCTASNPLPPAARKPGTVGLPLVDELVVMGEAGPARPGELGEVWVRGPQVTAGYRGDERATAESFVDGWLRTGDVGTRDDDGYLSLVGRSKEMINRAGETISPREIDDVLCEHPDVARAVTFAVPDARLGEQVAALVVPREGASPSERALRGFALERLSPPKVPRRIVIGATVPVTPTGKPRRDGLAAALGLADLDGTGGPPPPDEAPRTEVECFLAELWCEVLHLDHVGVHSRFLDLGGDSLRAARLLGRVRDEIDIEISILDFFDAPTIAAQAALLDSLLLAADGS